MMSKQYEKSRNLPTQKPRDGGGEWGRETSKRLREGGEWTDRRLLSLGVADKL